MPYVVDKEENLRRCLKGTLFYIWFLILGLSNKTLPLNDIIDVFPNFDWNYTQTIITKCQKTLLLL